MTESSADNKRAKETLDERAADAKFYLSVGSGSFFLTGIILLLSAFLLILPPNITTSLIFAAICYVLPGGVLFFWGLVKIFRGKDLTFEQVRRAHIQRKDLRKTAKFLLFVSFFAILLILPILIGQSAQDLLHSVINFTLLVLGPSGLYVGIFLISIIGNFTVIFPVPYILVLGFVASQEQFTLLEGLIMGLMAGLGAAIGETSAWLLGRSQTEALEDSATGQRLMKVKDQVERGWGGLLVFFYAATPLPDDFLLIALGATKYPLWKAIIACFFGKVALALLVTIGVQLQLPFLTPFLEGLFGAAADPIQDTLYLVVGIIIILLIFFVPWGKFGRRIFRRKNTE